MRRRYRYSEELGKLVEITDEKPAPPSGPFVLADIEQHYGAPIISPIDGSVITSRSQLRAHNNTHGVRQNGDYKPGEIIAMNRKRSEENRRRAEGQLAKWL